MKRFLWILAVGLVLSPIIYAKTPVDNSSPMGDVIRNQTIVGVLSWKYANHHGKYLDIIIQSADQKYTVTGTFLADMEAVEPRLKELAKKHVMVKGDLAPESRNAPRCIMVAKMADIQEQQPVELSGSVTKEKGQDAKGRPITRVFLDVAGKKYEAVGKQAQGKLAPVNARWPR
jgi:hypothetical protein